jgi:hypothetical protein
LDVSSLFRSGNSYIKVSVCPLRFHKTDFLFRERGLNISKEFHSVIEDSNGKFDIIEQTNCKVSGVFVSVNMGPYEEAGPNFRYIGVNGVGYTSTVMMYASDIVLKNALSETCLGYVAGTALDCLFAYVST